MHETRGGYVQIESVLKDVPNAFPCPSRKHFQCARSHSNADVRTSRCLHDFISPKGACCVAVMTFQNESAFFVFLVQSIAFMFINVLNEKHCLLGSCNTIVIDRSPQASDVNCFTAARETRFGNNFSFARFVVD